MKLSTIMAVTTLSLAFVTTGCKYDAEGAEGADDAAVTDISTDELAEGAEGGTEAVATEELTEGDDINALAGDKRFEDLYTKCTDVSFEPVYFGFDSTMVPSAELGKVDAVAQHLGEKADRVVVIEGNCDERGSNEYNVILGESRATILRNYLVQNGIAADRIQTRSYGEEKPALEGHNETAWSRNRRGEFVIFQK